MSHFELKDKEQSTKGVFRFDFFPTVVNGHSWKEECCNLPEFDIDYQHSHFRVIQENKPHKVVDITKKLYYYPGFEFCIRTVRDPQPKIQRAFFPCVVLGIFLYCTFDVSDIGLGDTEDLYATRISNLSVCLLTYVAIMD